MFKLEEISEKVYLLSFDRHYDLCMHFMRYQEYYESPKFKGEFFNIIDFVDWYTVKYGKGTKFTYVDDWGGFNIPGNIIQEVYSGISDHNRYDHFMLSIFEYLNTKCSDFYLIGATTLNDIVINHELAHGLYYTNKEYFEKMKSLCESIPDKETSMMNKKLVKMGYHTSVLRDETQAYLATGLSKELDVGYIKELMPDFEKVFNRYRKKR